jgi:hypothetical protein
MDPSQVRRRLTKGIPGGTPVNPTVTHVGSGRLHDYSLSFSGHSKTWGGATATVIPDPGSVTPGILYVTDPEQERVLGWFENADGHADPALYNTYRKVEVVIEGDDGLLYPSYIFVNTSDESATPPSKKYLGKIKKAYKDIAHSTKSFDESSAIRECIVVGGRASGGHILGKTRDRNYRPHLEIVRDLTDTGIEIVYLHDVHTNYMEGMNSHGIGKLILRSLLWQMKKLDLIKRKRRALRMMDQGS